MVGRRLPLLIVVLVSVLAMSSNAAVAERVPPGGAPRPGSGSRDVDGFVRVIDGDTIEAWVDGQRTAIGLVGIEAPMGNTDCGKQATARLWSLVKGGVHLEEDPGSTFDHLSRRMYHVKTRDGRLIPDELARAGLVRANGKGREKQRIADAEEDARRSGRGCATRRNAAAQEDDEARTAMSTSAADDEATALLRALPAADDLSSTAAAVAAAPAAATLPGGFTEDVLATRTPTNGFERPTAFAFLPDGRILIALQNGVVRVFKDGALLPTPFIDLQDRVNDYWDHGLLGITVDPNFATNGYVYLLYTYENNPADYEGKKSSRLARYTAVGDTASPSSELVLLGSVVGAGCESQLMADCIPSEYASHSVGNVKFASDGTLFVSTGDGASFNEVDDRALRAQNLDSLAGKMLRITTTGAGIPTNPFWNGNASANRSKVWAYGLRNAYRFNLQPGSDEPYFGDVGWNSTEEISVAKRGANMGWPCYEGPAQQTGYASKPVCQALYSQGAGAHRAPIISWGHNFGGTCCSSAATGGVFYTRTAYPAQYQGAYFYADYGKDWIRYLRTDGNDALVPGSDSGFATGLGGPVDLELGPDGNLYYLSIETNQLRRIRYVGGTNQPPIAAPLANPSAGLTPLTVQFTGSGSADPNGDPLSYSWDFGDGSTPSTEPNPQHTYQQNGVYTASLTVSDGRGGTDTESRTITVGNEPPIATINSPSSSFRYKVDDVITYSGSANDPEDGALTGESLRWEILIHHCPGGQCHQHILTTSTGSNGSFTVPDHGDDSHFEIRLTATDSVGLEDTKSVSLQAQTVKVTLATSPTGLNLLYDGGSDQAPQVKNTVPGSTHTIEAPNQPPHQFASWSDGGTQQHQITVGASDATYTATFVQLPTVNFDDKSGQNQPLNGQYPSGVIDWGNGKWYHSGPWGPLTSKSVSFESGGVTSATMTFLTPRRLVSLQAYNGGGATTVTLSCPDQTTKTQALGPGALVTIETGWTGACTTVTIGSTNGWDTNFDNLVHDGGGPPPPDTTPPTITGRSPTGGATNVAVDANVTATFSEDVLEVSGSTFQLKDGGGAVVPATVTYDSSSRTATLNPNASLANGASYSVTLTGGAGAIRDQEGNALANDTWSFTTVGAPPQDTTPPTISNRSPAVGAPNVAVDANVTATFSEDVLGVSGSTFQLRDGNNALVAASVTYNASTRTATLDPSASLANSATYTVSLTGGANAIRDQVGNALANVTWTFTTTAPATTQTITFDDRSGQDQGLNGQYPTGVINWGTNDWYHSGPYGALTSKSASFNGGGVTSKSFTFMAARKLVSLTAYNGGGGSTTVTISCNGQTKTQSIPAGQAVTITTGFTDTCTTVTLSSTNGWDTNFDDIVVSTP